MNPELFPESLKLLLGRLHREFEGERSRLLTERKRRQAEYDAGDLPKFQPGHPAKTTSWSVAAIPNDLLDRRVEITGPISSAKMAIQMLSANQDGEIANTAMLDFEDSMAPTWENVQAGLKNIVGIAQKNLVYVQAATLDSKEKIYQLDPKKMAHPMVRVRGLHLLEKNFAVDGSPISAGLFDLTCTAFHTAKVFLADGKTPKFYVPKCEHFEEARWWNKLFQALEESIQIPKGSLRCTFLIETLPAAFLMEEILYEIRERACGLNGGRWDKIFSDIKTLKMHKDRVLADRGSIDMSRPWMDAYAKLLIQTCHRHGAFAMGGMSAFTPGKDAELRKVQTEKVIADKKREASIGHDGCWVSHPYFITAAKRQFLETNQLGRKLEELTKNPDLLPKSDGPKTLNGLRQNLRVGIAYQQGWNHGVGCVAFENLMEDLATLEISRAQVWQWLHHKVVLDDGTFVTRELITRLFDEELEKIFSDLGITEVKERADWTRAKEQIREVFLQQQLAEFFN